MELWSCGCEAVAVKLWLWSCGCGAVTVELWLWSCSGKFQPPAEWGLSIALGLETFNFEMKRFKNQRTER